MPNPLTWVEIERGALTHNLKEFRRLIGKKRTLAAVVKANAYGHGISQVSEIAVQTEADWLAVNSLEEALILQEKKIKKPILVLGYVPISNLKTAIKHGFRLTVYNRETIQHLSKEARKIKKRALLHLKVETGTNRQGITEENLLSYVRRIKQEPYLKLEGLSTHFANIEDTTDHSYAQCQLEKFKRILSILQKERVKIPIRHTACTAATILFPETYFEMVRVGIGLYGLWPSKETYLSCLQNGKKAISLKPVLTWKTRIAQIKTVPAGSFIGYGCTFRTSRKTRLAILPVGYYDGYDRGLSNLAYVLINGKRAPVRGRICMNITLVDVTDIPQAKLEDEVVLLGKQDKEKITAEYLAGLCGSINYEIVSRINSEIPRIVIHR
ncbi:MAG: alanine racemase [Candidatus Edwardsbacteria bacterium]